MAITQADRLIRVLQGPLDPNETLLTRFTGQEQISRPFLYALELLSTQLDIQPASVMGKQMAFEIDRRTASGDKLDPRTFDGYINRFYSGPVEKHAGQSFRHYRAEVVPWLWFLTRTSRCYIFFPERDKKSVFDIVEAVFNRAVEELRIDALVDMSGVVGLKNRMLQHCVQYRETDFSFVSRLMERFGVFYFFRQVDGKHQLVLKQDRTYPQCEESEVEFPGLTGTASYGYITDWEHAYEFVSGKWAHADYNFETPLTRLNGSSGSISQELSDESRAYEIYDYPGEFDQQPEADSEARLRQELEETPHDLVHGSSGCLTFSAGHTFTLLSHPDLEDGAGKREKRSYLITAIRHAAEQTGTETGGPYHQDYSNTFNCIPDTVQFRPPRVTPKPVVAGVQTAVVVGPAGKEIYTDQFGRVRVCFHWDREGQLVKTSKGGEFSCWIRVSQPVAGRQWGFMALPRIGQEVVVEFLEGDPDRPLVIGAVYNKDQMPHYPPHEHETKTYIKTNSSLGGQGFNELMFEDKSGSERVFLHAEKNMDIRVKDECRETVGGGRDQSVGGARREVVSKNASLDVGGDQHTKVGGLCALDAGSEIHLKGGAKVVIEAGLELTIQGGGGFVSIGPDGVTIQGTMVKINSGGSPATGSGCRPESPDDAHDAVSGRKSNSE